MRTSVYAPFIDALIDEAGLPTITDVRLDGTTWTGLDAYSFADRVQVGEQFRPIATESVNTLEIEFSEHVLIEAGDLDLQQTIRLSGGDAQTNPVAHTNFVYDVGAHVATWTFSTLADGKYAIHLTDDVTDAGGNQLDAEWDNPTNGTPDVFSDDNLDPLYVSTLVTGNGTAGSTAGEFRFHFALLAGDYNGDGEVTSADNPAAAGIANGDGDGDGIAGDTDDINIRTTQIAAGAKLPLQFGGGDFDDNEIVDDRDLILWEQEFGNAGFDGASFLAWQRAFGDQGAWFTGVSPLSGLGNAATTIGLPPQVLNLIISGSVSTHNPFSFDTVDGSGDQLKTVGVGGADTVSIAFSEDVNVSAGSLYVVGLYTANLPVLAAFSYDTAAYTASWRFESWALGDQYLLSLSDLITDVDGNRLDGEWVNPASVSTVNSLVSTFPSGDGIAGGRFNFVATILPGDLDLNGIVDDTDLLMYDEGLDQYGHLQSGVVWSQGDLNGDGVVDELDDWNLFVAHEGLDLQDLWILGDFDGDYDIDVDDIDLINQNFGMTGATWADGDLNGDGIVDLDDLDLAFAQYGMALAVVS